MLDSENGNVDVRVLTNLCKNAQGAYMEKYSEDLFSEQIYERNGSHYIETLDLYIENVTKKDFEDITIWIKGDKRELLNDIIKSESGNGRLSRRASSIATQVAG